MKKIKVSKFLIITFFICFCLYITTVNIEVRNNNTEEGYLAKWNDKSWITLGDSITKANGYQPIVKDKLGLIKVENKGINGQTMAYQKTEKSTYNICKDIDYNEYDLVTIFIGTNDFRYNKELGEIKISESKAYDEKTFIGGYQKLIEKILESNPEIDLVLITPLQRTKDGFDINHKNKAGYKLIDYVDSVENLGEMYSLPVLDLYSNSGFTKQTMDTYTKDGLHPNDVGYKRIADKIYRFLISI